MPDAVTQTERQQQLQFPNSGVYILEQLNKQFDRNTKLQDEVIELNKIVAKKDLQISKHNTQLGCYLFCGGIFVVVFGIFLFLYWIPDPTIPDPEEEVIDLDSVLESVITKEYIMNILHKHKQIL